MTLQKTLKDAITLQGIEPYGGNRVELYIEPANSDMGFVFRTNRGLVPATLANAFYDKSAIAIKHGKAKVGHVEHILATLYGMGLDNALISVERIPEKTLASISYNVFDILGLAAQEQVVPRLEKREATLCQKIQKVGLETQGKEQKIVRIERKAGSEYLWFVQNPQEGLTVETKAKYGPIEEREFEIAITPRNYHQHLAASRPYAKHIENLVGKVPCSVLSLGASLVNWQYGLSHGFDKQTYLLPNEGQIYPQEIARHSIVDRLGALALLGLRFDHTKVISDQSGHREDLETLREIAEELSPRVRPSRRAA